MNIPLAPLAPIQRIGYLSGHIVCKESIGPFRAGGLYPARTSVRPARASALWEDALGRSTELELRSQETIAVVGGIEHGFAPASVRVNSELPILGDYQALLDHFDIPEVRYLGDTRTGQMQSCLERVCQLEELIGKRQSGFTYLPHQSEDLARAMLTDGAILAWMTGLGKALGLLSWPLLKLGWMADDFLYPREPAIVLCPDELVEQLEAEAKRFFGLHPMILTRFNVTEPGLYLAGYHRLAGKIDTLRNPQAFAAVAMDEATKIKSADSQIGRAARRLAPRYRMVASATPIKNRIVDFFWLLWWVPQARALDGRNTPGERSRVAKEFAAGGFQILAAGDNSMGLGFNFAHCRFCIWRAGK